MINNDRGITDELLMDILKNVKLMLNITDDSKDTLLVLYIKALCTNMLTKTNRRIFVPDMKYVIMDLVIDKYTSGNDISGIDTSSIQSMSEAGRSVTFGATNVVANRLNLIAQKQLDENDYLINKFKLLYKI